MKEFLSIERLGIKDYSSKLPITVVEVLSQEGIVRLIRRWMHRDLCYIRSLWMVYGRMMIDNVAGKYIYVGFDLERIKVGTREERNDPPVTKKKRKKYWLSDMYLIFLIYVIKVCKFLFIPFTFVLTKYLPSLLPPYVFIISVITKSCFWAKYCSIVCKWAFNQ